MYIHKKEIRYSDYSILDDFGRVFFWNDRVFRGISAKAHQELNHLRKIGLLDELEAESLFPKTTLTDFESDDFEIIIEHEKISPASFVYEWPFDMVKAAGECILNVNLIAAKYDYQTIDAHPYNILFKGCNPVFIDIGSLMPAQNSTSWIALDEFYGYFKYPLEIWNKVSYKMARRIYSEDLTNITTFEYNKLRDLSAYKYHADARQLFRRVKNKIERVLSKNTTRSEKLKQVKADLNKLTNKKVNTQWGNYHDDYVTNNEMIASSRFNTIIDKIKELNIENITELAGNWGLLSHLIFQHTSVKRIICTDYDENAVNKMYNHFKSTAYAQQLYPALIDFIKPIELSNGGRPSARFQSQAVLALAVTHHLVLTFNYNIDVILSKISDYSSKYVFIEFMPLGLWDGNYAPPIPEFYTQTWFTQSFEKRFKILDILNIETNRILYIGIKSDRED